MIIASWRELQQITNHSLLLWPLTDTIHLSRMINYVVGGGAGFDCH